MNNKPPIEDTNIEKFSPADKAELLEGEKALFKILDEYSAELQQAENTQKALLNILQDYSEEKKKIEIINNDLVAANKELAQFAYVASHDLQEPLQTIASFVTLLEEKYAGYSDEETTQYMQFIINATSKMQLLIKHLLDFSRIGRNMKFQNVDCNEIVKEVIEDLKNIISESNAKISFSNLPVISGEPMDIKQLFQNLISNGIKFRKKNTNPEIKINCETNNDEYIFSIQDNGIGIDEKYKDRLFIIFQRLVNASDYPGTGIGLATCKKIVTLHKGKIWFESKLNEGTTFYFSIPKIKQQ